MSSEENNESEQEQETEREEKQQHIPYRYENAKDNEYQSAEYKNNVEVSESGGDIMKKINEEADNLESLIDKNKLKIFSKYEDLNEKQLKKLIEERNENILKINNQKENSKNILSELLKKLNKTITDNTDILYKEQPDPEILFNLQKEIESRNKELKLVKNMNHSCKCQYNAMNHKFNQKSKNEKINGEIKINNLKNENKKLQIGIRKYKDDDINIKKDVQKIVEGKEFPNEIKIKSEEIRNLTNQKHECYTKMSICIKSLENLKQEINHLEESLKKNYKDKKNYNNLNNKINFWIDLIKSDLNRNHENLIKKIESNETNFMKEINKIENKNNYGKVKSSSFDENKKSNTNLQLSYNLKQKKQKKIGDIIKSKGIIENNNYLKQKPYSSMNNKYKINIPFEEKKTNKFLDIKIIIENDYENTTDSDYRQLLDKKTQYLETNMRLEKNIKEIERTKKSKILDISFTVQENEKRLKELKLQNDLLEQEIINLENLYQLTIDKERLKKEIKMNKNIVIEENNKKKQKLFHIKLETSLATENIILNELKDSKEKIKETPKKKNKNRSGYRDDFIPDQTVIETRKERLKKIREKYIDENEFKGKEENIHNGIEIKNYEKVNKKDNIRNEDENENNIKINDNKEIENN